MIGRNSAESAKPLSRIQASAQTFPRFMLRCALILLLPFALLPLGIRAFSPSSPACVDITGADYVIDLTHWVIVNQALGNSREVVASPDKTAQAIFIRNYPHPSALVLKTAEGQHQLTGDAINAIWSHTGDRLFYIHSDDRERKTATLTALDPQGNLLREVLLPPLSGINNLQLSPDDQLLAVQSDNSILIYRIEDFQLVDQLPPVSYAPNFVWSPVGHSAFLAQDTQILVWSQGAGSLLSIPGVAQGVRWSPDGQSLAVLTRASGEPYVSPSTTYHVGVYSLDGTIAQHLFDSAAMHMFYQSDNRVRVVWLDAHTLALWKPTSRGDYALVHYDVVANQYTTIIDHAVEPGLFLPDKQHVLYRVADGDHVHLMLASITDGQPVMLTESFGTTNSFYTLQYSPDLSSFIITLKNAFSENMTLLWSRNDGTRHIRLPSVSEEGWLGASMLVYRGEDANGAYAGLINTSAGTATRVLDAMDQISFIPVEQARRHGGYITFYWQKAGVGSAFDLYNAAGERLYRLPSDLNMTYMMGPYLNPVLFLSPDAKGVIVRSQEQRWQFFNDGQLISESSRGNPEDVLWFPDSSAALVMSVSEYSNTEINQLDRDGTLERTLTTPYLSYGSHMTYQLNWCALDSL